MKHRRRDRQSWLGDFFIPNMKCARYRVGQFLRALTARVSDTSVVQATQTLPPKAQLLFRRQAAQDQYHAMAVYRALRKAGHTNRDLLAAALLHDVGKAAARISPVHRAIIVLLEAATPDAAARWRDGKCRFWNRPFVAHARHAGVGARWAQQAGCSPLTAALIRRHEENVPHIATEEDRLLVILQAADSAH